VLQLCIRQVGVGSLAAARQTPSSKKLDGEIAIDMVMQFFKNECDARARACNKDTCDQLPV